MKLRSILLLTTAFIYVIGIGGTFLLGLELMPKGTPPAIGFLWLIAVLALSLCGYLFIDLPGRPAKLWPAVAIDEIVQIRMVALNAESVSMKNRWLLIVQIGDDQHNLRFISTKADCGHLKPGFFYRYDGHELKSIMGESRPLEAAA